MQTTLPELRSSIPTEHNLAIASTVPPEFQYPSRWRRAGVALVAGVALAACDGGGETVYGVSNLASAPHDARVDLPAGTAVVFEELETAKCKPHAMDVYAGSIVLATATPKPKKTVLKTKPPTPGPVRPRGPVTVCEGAEIEAEACQTGGTPNTNPETVAANCVHADFDPAAFAGATGLDYFEDNQLVTLTGPLTGTADRD